MRLTQVRARIVFASSQAAIRDGRHRIDKLELRVEAVDKWGKRPWQDWLFPGVSFGKLSRLVRTIVAKLIRPTPYRCA